jgi:Rad3-related DNA helicase
MAPISIMNPEYFLYESNNVGMFSGRGFVTLDEADKWGDILMSFIELKISDSMITKYGITHPRYKTKPESWQQWAHETIQIVNDQLSKLTGLFGVEDLREQQKLERLKSKLMFFEKEANDNWIYDSSNNVFKPIKIAPYCEQFLWRHAEKFLLMSATLAPMPLLCVDLGIDIKDAACFDVPSIFASEQNLVHVRPVADMSFKTQDNDFDKMIFELDHIMDEHPDVKGLVHCVSYSRRDRILRSSRHYDRLITHNPNDREAKLNQFINNPEPLVFLSPAVERGIDLRDDLCRFIVLTKVPFSNLHDDRQAAARYYSSSDGKKWYASQTARRIVQCLGRGCRSEADYCSNYILDKNFIRFYGENRLMFPRWWRDTVRIELKEEVMTV